MKKIDSDHSMQNWWRYYVHKTFFFFKMKSLMPWIMQTAVDSTVPEAEIMNFHCMRIPIANSWDIWIMNCPNHGPNWPLYTCKAESMTKQTMWLWHCCKNILLAWRIMWVKIWVRNDSWHAASVSTIVQPWEKWWSNTGKGSHKSKNG